MPKCPYCKTVVINSIKEWNYHRNYYQVKDLLCQHCGINFRAYYHDSKFSHTIPKSLDRRTKILKYFRVHGEATIEEITDSLNEKKSIVESIMNELLQRYGFETNLQCR